MSCSFSFFPLNPFFLQLKQYVSSVKNKGAIFKKNKDEFNAIRTERGILGRTMDIISVKEKELMDMLNVTEEEKGISGYFELREEKRRNEVDAPGSVLSSSVTSSSVPSSSLLTSASVDSNQSTGDLTGSMKKLNESINTKKKELNGLSKDLRPLRQEAHDLQNEYDKQKATYDSTAAGLESILNQIQQEVKRLRQEVHSEESLAFQSKCDLEITSAIESLLMTKAEIEGQVSQQQNQVM